MKDKKIIYYLLQNSRQSYKSLGKKVGISRELAAYRMNKLVKENIISKFPTNIDAVKLGYGMFNLFFNFKNINPNIKNDIIDFSIKKRITTYVSLIEGIYDFQIEVLLGDPFEFESFYDEMQDKFHQHLDLQYMIAWIRGEKYNYPFLINTQKNNMNSIKWFWGGDLYLIDELDFKILKELSVDSRKPTKKIAYNVDSTVNIVNNKIKKMIKKRIITDFTINVNWELLGFDWYHLQIYLNDYDKKSQIIQFIRQNPYLIRILKGFFFNVDIHCTFLFQNQNQLRELIEKITTHFPKAISNYNFYRTYKIFKHDYMIPELLAKKNPFCYGGLNFSIQSY